MEKLKVGSMYEIHCYKHNGKIHRTWDETIILDIKEDLLICGNNNVTVTESNGRKHKTKEITIIFFYTKRWFNVFAQFKKKGLFYKCNIATPYLVDDNVIKFIDYDLDLKVFPDGTFRVLDRNEYKYHKLKMKYSEDLDRVLQSELTELINMKRAEVGPFNKKVIEEYYQKYLKITQNN
ncbi:MAG: DUF402 domain-containing protein [Bacilli bacterium]|nr:DUF402 domain-containing protein [Bacilli bacterium]